MSNFYIGNISKVSPELLKIIVDSVSEVRKALDQRCQVNKISSPNYRFAGLCTEASRMVTDAISDKIKGTSIESEESSMEIIHGELLHKPRLLSQYWSLKHTWCRLRFGDSIIYVDPTAGQFKRYFKEIPDVYISSVSPKWYLPDENNIRFRSRLLRMIDTKIKIRVMEEAYPLDLVKAYYGMTDTLHVNIGLVECCQYIIWGTISDWVYRLNHIKIKKRGH